MTTTAPRIKKSDFSCWKLKGKQLSVVNFFNFKLQINKKNYRMVIKMMLLLTFLPQSRTLKHFQRSTDFVCVFFLFFVFQSGVRSNWWCFWVVHFLRPFFKKNAQKVMCVFKWKASCCLTLFFFKLSTSSTSSIFKKTFLNQNCMNDSSHSWFGSWILHAMSVEKH